MDHELRERRELGRLVIEHIMERHELEKGVEERMGGLRQ